MSLANLRTTILAQLNAAITADAHGNTFTWYKQIPAQVATPCGFLHFPGGHYQETMGAAQRTRRMRFTVTVLFMQGGSVLEAQDDVDALVEGAGSVDVALDGLSLSPDASMTPTITDWSFGPIEMNGTPYIGTVFNGWFLVG